MDILITGVLLGATYSLIAMGLNLQYGVARIMNLANGEMLVAGAFGAFWVYTAQSANPFAAALFVVPGAFLLNWLIYRYLLRPLVRRAKNRGMLEVDTILATAGLLDCFKTIVSAEDVARGKPEPEIFLKALAALNAQHTGAPIAAGECLVIEDSKEGIRGARRAGMKCLAVTNSHPAELLIDANAVVRSLEEVTLSYLQKLCV